MDVKNWDGVPLEMVEKMYQKYKLKQITGRQLLEALGCKTMKQITAFLWRRRGRGPNYDDPGMVPGQNVIPWAVIEGGKK